MTAYAVTRRTGEVGVRKAVGARPQQILWMVLRQVVAVAAAAGLVPALRAARLDPRSALTTEG